MRKLVNHESPIYVGQPSASFCDQIGKKIPKKGQKTFLGINAAFFIAEVWGRLQRAADASPTGGDTSDAEKALPSPQWLFGY
jgi:hypothetical protein